MSLSPVEIGADAVAGLLAASKLLPATQPLWAKLPRVLAVALPVVVLDLPQLLALFGVVTTETSLLSAVIASVALLLPGIAEAEKPAA